MGDGTVVLGDELVDSVRVPFSINAKQVDDGFDITVNVDDGYYVDLERGDNDEVVVRMREKRPPRIGERRMVHGRLIKVAQVRYDAGGNRWLLDADTMAWEMG